MAEDIRPNWLNVARRCQAALPAHRGFVVLTLRVLVAPTGDPVLWLTPDVQEVEPITSSSQFLIESLTALSRS